MKCTRCIMYKKGCDGIRPQCENCRKSKKDCEWVEAGVTRRALESQIAGGKLGTPGSHQDLMSEGGLNNEEEVEEQVSTAHDDFEEHLQKIQEEMEDPDDEEEIPEDDDNATIFDKTTRMYEEYKLTEGTIADKWAREANSNLQLNWREHPTEISHYSHGDSGGLGLTSNMEKKLGKEPSNQTYQPHRQLGYAQAESIPIQDWERVGSGPIGGYDGIAIIGADLSQTLSVDALYGARDLRRYGAAHYNSGYGVSAVGIGVAARVGLSGGTQGFGMAALETTSSTSAEINWSDWVNEDYDEEGYFHFITPKD